MLPESNRDLTTYSLILGCVSNISLMMTECVAPKPIRNVISFPSTVSVCVGILAYTSYWYLPYVPISSLSFFSHPLDVWCIPHGLVLCSKLLVPPSPPSPPRFHKLCKLVAVSSDNFCPMSLLSTVKTNVPIIIPQPSPLLPWNSLLLHPRC